MDIFLLHFQASLLTLIFPPKNIFFLLFCAIKRRYLKRYLRKNQRYDFLRRHYPNQVIGSKLITSSQPAITSSPVYFVILNIALEYFIVNFCTTQNYTLFSSSCSIIEESIFFFINSGNSSIFIPLLTVLIIV